MGALLHAGTVYLKEYINKMVVKGKYGFDELSRRINIWVTLEQPTKKEVEAVVTNNGITDSDSINFLYNTCKNYGTLNSVITMAKSKSENPDLDLLMQTKVN